MAAGGDYKCCLNKFATKGDKKELTTKDMNRWCTDAGGIMGKNCNSNHLDIAFTKAAGKGKKTLTSAGMDTLVTELGKMYLKDKKCDQATAETQIREKLGAAEPKGHGTTGTSKTGGVGRMTDASSYTGAHKERFDADGKGKGIDGRADRSENKGYTGQYKGEGSFDKKK